MKVVVAAGGDAEVADVRHLADADLLIAADGGAAWLEAAGRVPDLLLGDLDSASPALVEQLAGAGVSIERHPMDKDATDAELALGRAVAAGATVVVVVGALGGHRLDHAVANLLLPLGAAAGQAEVRIVRGGTLVRALRGGRVIAVEVGIGGMVSLVPVGGDAQGVVTRGLRFPLQDETLPMGGSRGVSNVVDAAEASVSLEAGSLLVIETVAEGEGR